MGPTAQDRLATLVAWRRGAMTALVALLGLTVSGELEPALGLSGVAVATVLLGSVQFALWSLLECCALDPAVARVPVVARYRRRLCSARRRRSMVASLRQTVQDSRHAPRNDLVQWDRVRRVAPDLLAVAAELEAVDEVDVRTMLELDRLLTDGRRSPLLNARVLEGETHALLRSARFRLQAAPSGPDRAPDSGPPKIGTSTDGGLAAFRLISSRLAGNAAIKKRRYG